MKSEDFDLSKMTVEDLFRAKQERRQRLANLPFEQKIEIVKRLQTVSSGSSIDRNIEACVKVVLSDLGRPDQALSVRIKSLEKGPGGVKGFWEPAGTWEIILSDGTVLSLPLTVDEMNDAGRPNCEKLKAAIVQCVLKPSASSS